MRYDLIDRRCKELGLSRRKLAVLSGVSENTITSAFKRKTKALNSDIVKKLSKVLDVRWFDLYDELDDYIDSMTPSDWTLASNIDEDDLEFIRRFAPMPTQFTDSLNAVEQAVIDAMNQLNAEGQKTALERVEELTEIRKYRKDE